MHTKMLPSFASHALDLAQIPTPDEGDEFIPFGVRQPNGICAFTDRYALVGDLDLWAGGAIRAKAELDRFHIGPP